MLVRNLLHAKTIAGMLNYPEQKVWMSSHRENYSKLCELSKDDFHFIKPEEGPDVRANIESWYGLYYDNKGQLQSLKIHEKDAHGDHDTDD